MLKIVSSKIIPKYIESSRVDLFLDEVQKANRHFNLYSRKLTRNDLKVLIAESLIPLEVGWIRTDMKELVDIGSGWGIPALPLLLADIPARVTLVERSRKKADFLLLLLRRLRTDASVLSDAKSSASRHNACDIVTVRGITVDQDLIADIKPVSAPGARIVYFGPDFPERLFVDPQYVDYSVDTLPSRRLWTAGIL